VLHSVKEMMNVEQLYLQRPRGGKAEEEEEEEEETSARPK